MAILSQFIEKTFLKAEENYKKKTHDILTRVRRHPNLAVKYQLSEIDAIKIYVYFDSLYATSAEKRFYLDTSYFS